MPTRVNKGDPPISSEKDPLASKRKDFFVLYREEQAQAQETLVQIVSQRLPKLGFNPLQDIQVLTPMHAESLEPPISIRFYSKRSIQMERAIPQRAKISELATASSKCENDYENEIYNGDVGFVTAIHETGISVRFEENEVQLSGGQLSDLDLAYAISIHKKPRK